MTAYSVWGTDGELAVKAGLYELRIHSVAIYNLTIDYRLITLQRYEGSTFSGGATVTVQPQRDGAPEASATARQGTALSLDTANRRRFGVQLVPEGAQIVTRPDFSTYTDFSGTTSTITPALDITVAPGHVFSVGTPGTTGALQTSPACGAIIYFEELRLNWTY